jgi:hypothetical protein
MRRAVWYRSRASRPRHASSSENEYIPLLRGARRRRCLIDLCLLDFFLYLGGAAATGVARFPVSVTMLGLVGRPPDAGRFSDDRARWLSCRSLGVGGVVRGVFSGNAPMASLIASEAEAEAEASYVAGFPVPLPLPPGPPVRLD